MDFDAFIHSRRPRWERLDAMLDRIDRSTLGALTPEEAEEFFGLYRLVSSDLNLVQTRTANPALLEYLEHLVGRAYANLSVPRRTSILQSWLKIIRHHFPATIRRELPLLLMATTCMLAGAVFGFVVTHAAPHRADLFLTPDHLAQSPSERVAELERLEQTGNSRISTVGEHSFFSTFLFTHNIRVTILCFVLGMTLGIGTIVVLFANGAMLGSITALYLSDGVMTFFIAWIGPHGSIELPCIIFGGTAGLMLARAQLRRDEGTFLSQLRRLRPALVHLIIGTATLLVIAGTIEGGFSQINEPTLPYPLKIAVAAALFTALTAYLFLVPVRSRQETEEDLLMPGFETEKSSA
ncbi:MAG: chromate reductase [Phycisphaeraceae bacterium]|nr:chromate reductase [Phycisphaeraceae bacterium]